MGKVIQFSNGKTIDTPRRHAERTPARTPSGTCPRTYASARRKFARRVRSREGALIQSFESARRAVRDTVSDWGEALEIGAQRVETQARRTEARANKLQAQNAGSKLSKEYAGYAAGERGAAQMFARFVEIYAAQFKPIETVIRAARREVAAQIVEEYPNANDAKQLARCLKSDTPGKWLELWCFEDE